jgi:hypothetical protein
MKDMNDLKASQRTTRRDIPSARRLPVSDGPGAGTEDRESGIRPAPLPDDALVPADETVAEAR